MFSGTHRFLFLLTGLIFLTSCSLSGQVTPESYSSQITLLPYSASDIPQSPTQAISTVSPSPTTEPVIYTVVAGDSLSAIAFRFGVKLDALMLANPDVNPNSMSIGTRLVIPAIDNTGPLAESTISGLPTPVIQLTSEPNCYRMDLDTWLCFLLVKNDQPTSIENVTGKILISGSTASFTATCPLDIIPAGESLPLTAVIDLAGINPKLVTASLSSAIPVDETDPRYGKIRFINKQIVISTDLRSASISGEVHVASGGVLRVVGYAMDAQDHVVGYRIWDASGPLEAGDTVTFSINIFSLGGLISDVYLVSEARLR